MKAGKFISAVALALLMGVSASAQGEWEFGVKGGVALNMMPLTTLDPGDKFKANFGFQGGAYVNVYLSDVLMGQVELLYSRKGVSTINHTGEIAFDGAALQYERDIHYLQLPVLIGFHSLLDDKLRLMIGPELNVYLGDTIKSNYVSIYESEGYQVNPLNLGISAQSTYFLTDSLGIDLKLDFGLTRTFKDSTNDRGHNFGVQLGLSYRFGY